MKSLTNPNRAAVIRIGQWLVVASAAAAAPLVLAGPLLASVSLCLPLIILAFALDLLWGENKIVSFGHGAFFAGGGYLAGLILKGPQADTSATTLALLQPQNHQKSGFDQATAALADLRIAGVPVLAIVVSVIACAAVGAVVGMAIFRLPAAELYAPLITLGVGVVASAAFLSISAIGGSNGLSGIPSYVNGIGLGSEQQRSYWFNLATVAAVALGYGLYRRSWRGQRWRAAGNDPIRLEALGTHIAALRTAGFAVSAGLAGLAGALYVGTSGYISASFAGVAFSVQALIWIAVGGTGLFLGPIVGVLVVQLAQQYLSGWAERYWQILLGAALLIIVLSKSDGLVGMATTGRACLIEAARRRRGTAPR